MVRMVGAIVVGSMCGMPFDAAGSTVEAVYCAVPGEATAQIPDGSGSEFGAFRRPYRSPGAYMNFEGARTIRTNAPSEGLATIDGGAEVRRVRGTGPQTVPAQTPEMLAQQYDPLHPDFPPSADATISGPHLALHFRAAPDRDYVVSCRVRTNSDSADFGVRVAADDAYAQMLPALAPRQGRVSFAIRRASRARGIDLQIVAARPITGADGLGLGGVIAGQRLPVPFSVSRCDVTPLA